MYTIQNLLDIITQTELTLALVSHTCCSWYILNIDRKEVPTNSYPGEFIYIFIFIYLGKLMIYCGWWMDNLCQNIKNDLPFISYIPYKTINIARNIVSWYHLTSHLVIHLVCYLDYMDSKFIQWVTKYKHKHKPQLPKEEAHPRDSDLQRLVMYLANTWYLSSSAAHSLVNGLLLYSSSTTSWLYIGKHLTSLLTFTDCNPFSFSLFFKHLAK